VTAADCVEIATISTVVTGLLVLDDVDLLLSPTTNTSSTRWMVLKYGYGKEIKKQSARGVRSKKIKLSLAYRVFRGVEKGPPPLSFQRHLLERHLLQPLNF
jgi:hypothetical protein